MKCDICSKEVDKLVSYCIQIMNLSENSCETIYFKLCEKCSLKNDYKKILKSRKTK